MYSCAHSPGHWASAIRKPAVTTAEAGCARGMCSSAFAGLWKRSWRVPAILRHPAPISSSCRHLLQLCTTDLYILFLPSRTRPGRGAQVGAFGPPVWTPVLQTWRHLEMQSWDRSSVLSHVTKASTLLWTWCFQLPVLEPCYSYSMLNQKSHHTSNLLFFLV